MVELNDFAVARTAPPRRGWGDSFVLRGILSRLVGMIEHGEIHIQTPSGEVIRGAGAHPGPVGRLTLHRARAVRRLLLDGDIGFGESYMAGDWSSPDLAALIEVVALNHDRMMPALSGSPLARLAHRLLHLGHANTKRGSAKNIPAHYDLGNDFYAAWLDPDMTYSSGLYEQAGWTLEQAQTAKQDAVIDGLRLAGGERVLEIGCGWGALARRLAREHGCHVTGLTLSSAQLDHARGCVGDGYGRGAVDLRLQDYRDVRGSFDRIVSIEMLEAVGKAFWPTYFSTLRDRLRPGGTAVLQVITMADAPFATYQHSVDFIQRHIFPGGMIPTDGLVRSHAQAHGLVLDGFRAFGAGYAQTLNHWRERFHRAWPKLRGAEFDDRFQRKWDFYLSYCEGGFRAGLLDVGLYQLRRAVA